MELAEKNNYLETAQKTHYRSATYKVGFGLALTWTLITGLVAAALLSAALHIPKRTESTSLKNVLEMTGMGSLGLVTLIGLAILSDVPPRDLNSMTQFDAGQLQGAQTAAKFLIGPHRILDKALFN